MTEAEQKVANALGVTAIVRRDEFRKMDGVKLAKVIAAVASEQKVDETLLIAALRDGGVLPIALADAISRVTAAPFERLFEARSSSPRTTVNTRPSGRLIVGESIEFKP
jgi:hypothetical protein